MDNTSHRQLGSLRPDETPDARGEAWALARSLALLGGMLAGAALLLA